MSEPSKLKSWQALAAAAKPELKKLFAADPQRFKKLSFALPGLLADFSKQPVTDDTLKLLLAFAREQGLEAARDAMLTGAKINTSENRAVLHTALRAAPDANITIDGKNIIDDVQETLTRAKKFAENVRNGLWVGFNHKNITDIVNIGIGGSSLGPQLVTQALTAFHHPRIQCHYVANVEASDLEGKLKGLSPETTLFIVASKTFTTAETMQNANIARQWVLNHYKDEDAIAKHFVAASTNAAAVKTFGIAPDNMFPFWDWVGGRYSVWSAIGLSVMIMVGADNFLDFLEGAREMDNHFRDAPLEKNIPALMGLIGLWNRNFMGYPAYAVIPYHACLGRLPAFLQQLDMESNGKTVDKTGARAATATGPIIFGEPGTDAQHSFFQWLHQGSDTVPVDFVAAVKTPFGHKEQQTMLLANMLAQSEALMIGRESTTEPHRHFNGNRPSTTLLLDELSPKTFGMLLALYEHKVFVQGVLWGINSFDQWGVELGKIMAKALEADIKSGTPAAHDGSTLGLLEYIKSHSV